MFSNWRPQESLWQELWSVIGNHEMKGSHIFFNSLRQSYVLHVILIRLISYCEQFFMGQGRFTHKGYPDAWWWSLALVCLSYHVTGGAVLGTTFGFGLQPFDSYARQGGETGLRGGTEDALRPLEGSERWIIISIIILVRSHESWVTSPNLAQSSWSVVPP